MAPRPASLAGRCCFEPNFTRCVGLCDRVERFSLAACQVFAARPSYELAATSKAMPSDVDFGCADPWRPKSAAPRLYRSAVDARAALSTDWTDCRSSWSRAVLATVSQQKTGPGGLAP